MKGRIEKLSGVLGTAKQIDWLRLCQEIGAAGIRELLSKEPDKIENSLLYPLLKIACKALKKVDSSQLLPELKRFKVALDESLQLEKEGQAYFNGDYEVFSHFMVLLLAKENISPLKVGELWPDLDEEQAQERYEEVVRQLLAERGIMLLTERNEEPLPLAPDDVSRWNDELNSLLLGLLPHLRAEEKAQLEGIETYPILGVIWQAILGWFLYLSTLFETKKPPNLMESFAVLNSIWLMAKRNKLLTIYLKDESGSAEDLFAAYHEAKELDFSQIKRVSEPEFMPAKWFGDSTNEFVGDCRHDLQALETWASALFHSVVLTYIDEPDEGAKAYLEAFKQVREEIQAYGRSLYACRMKAEQAWRGSSNYLRRLGKLDAELADMDEGLIKLQRDLVQDIKEALEIKSFQAACTCFEVLVSEEMAVLNKVSWAGLTCYSWARNEGVLAYEMDARNEAYIKQSKNKEGLFGKDFFGMPTPYDLHKNRTQTDFLMTHYIKDEADSLRKKMRLLHPDRLGDYPGIEEIANYCSADVLNQLNYHRDVSRAWYAGQWYEESSSAEKENKASLEKEYSEKEPTIIPEPENPLGLGMFSLHRAYISWVKSQTSLIKEPRGALGPQHSLYSAADNEAYIRRDAADRRFYLYAVKARKVSEEQDAEILRIQEEIAENIRQTQEIRAQTKIHVEKRKEAEAKSKAEESMRKEAEAKSKAEESMRKEAEARSKAEESMRKEAEAKSKENEEKANRLAQKVTKLIESNLIRELELKLSSLSADPDKIDSFLLHLCEQVAENTDESVEHVKVILDSLLEKQVRFAFLKGTGQMASKESVKGSASAGFFAPERKGPLKGNQCLRNKRGHPIVSLSERKKGQTSRAKSVLI